MTRSEIMQKAWLIAKVSAEKFGGKPKDYLRGALKMSWKITKDIIWEKAKTGKKTLELCFEAFEKEFSYRKGKRWIEIKKQCVYFYYQHTPAHRIDNFGFFDKETQEYHRGEFYTLFNFR